MGAEGRHSPTWESYRPPETRPFLVQKFQAPEGKPPLQLRKEPFIKVIVREVTAAPHCCLADPPLPSAAGPPDSHIPAGPCSSSPGQSLLPGNRPSSPCQPPRSSVRQEDARTHIYAEPGHVLSRTGMLNQAAHKKTLAMLA